MLFLFREYNYHTVNLIQMNSVYFIREVIRRRKHMYLVILKTNQNSYLKLNEKTHLHRNICVHYQMFVCCRIRTAMREIHESNLTTFV